MSDELPHCVEKSQRIKPNMATVPSAARNKSPLKEKGGGFLDIDRDEETLQIPMKAHNLAGFRDWVLADDFPEKLKVMYLNGEVFIDMSKEEIRTHASLKTTIGTTLENLNQKIDFGNLYIDGVRIVNEVAEVSNNPDAVAVFWESLESGKVRYVERLNRENEIEGSPDWVMEIVSASSTKKDCQLLRKAYHKARIREYWLIDARGKDIDFRVLHWRKSGYAAAPDKDGWLFSQVFERFFRLTRQRDRRGAWRYRLEIKLS